MSFSEWVAFINMLLLLYVGCSVQVIIGLIAGFWGTVQYIPQVRQAWVSRSTRDLSLRALRRMASSHFFWILYGFVGTDTWTTAFYNSFNLIFALTLIWLKMRDNRKPAEIFPGIPAITADADEIGLAQIAFVDDQPVGGNVRENATT